MMPHAFDLRKLNREAGAIRAKDSALLSLTKQGYTQSSTHTRPLPTPRLAAPRHIFIRRLIARPLQYRLVVVHAMNLI